MDHFSDGVHRRRGVCGWRPNQMLLWYRYRSQISGTLGAVTAVLEPSALRRTPGIESIVNFNLELDRTHDRGVC